MISKFESYLSLEICINQTVLHFPIYIYKIWQDNIHFHTNRYHSNPMTNNPFHISLTMNR